MKAKDHTNLPRCCPWLAKLDDGDLQRVQRDLQLRTFEAGDVVCARGRPTQHWIGVFSGLLLVRGDAEHAVPGTPAVAPGGWLGDESLVRREALSADVVALRNSHLAMLPGETYLWLRERSLSFNRMLLARLEQRMRHCVQQVHSGRAGGADERVAQTLVGLFDPVLHPAVGQTLRVTQEELAGICGLSRQRVNQALQRLAALGTIRLRYGSVELAEEAALRGFVAPGSAAGSQPPFAAPTDGSEQHWA